jgi:hypothetical protein
MSAFTPGRSASADGRSRVALACLFALLAFTGSSASSAIAADPPLATTEPASGATASGVTLNGKVNPKGAAVAVCRFEYGTTTEYGATAPCQPASLGTGTFNVSVSASLEGLESGTAYHFRLVATSVNGATNGADFTFATAGTPACPNAERRLEQGIAAILLPDCMALEQVSPPKKGGAAARLAYFHPNGGAGQAGGFSADGTRVLFRSAGALADTPAFNNYVGDMYVAVREAGRRTWETHPTTPPEGLVKGMVTFPNPGGFAADLSHWFTIAATFEQFTSGLGRAFRGGLGGAFEPLSLLLTPLSGTPEGPDNNVEYASRGSSADSSRYYFTVNRTITYIDGDPTPAPAGAAVANTYITKLDPFGDPSLQLLARDGTGKVWGGSCGAAVAGGRPVGSADRDRGAIAADGSRTYFTTRPDQPETGNCTTAPKKRIMVRDESGAEVEIRELFESECDRVADPGPPEVLECGKTLTGPAPPAGGNTVPDADDVYEGASIEGTRVYFTTTRQLVDSDVNGFDSNGISACVGSFGFGPGGCDLYLYDAAEPDGEQLTQVTAGSSGTATPSVASMSGDGSRLYFNSTEVLTADTGPAIPDTADTGANNLYLYDAEADELSFIARTTAGSAYPVPVLGPDPNALGVGGDGRRLFFTSSAPLTADDADAAADVFRYDAEADDLLRITRAAPGGSEGSAGVSVGPTLGGAGTAGPDGALNVPMALAGGARWVSEDGRTVGFKTSNGLAPEDDNGIADSYAWHAGTVFRLPGTTDPFGVVQGGDQPMVSPTGGAIAFQTFEPLLAGDGDTAMDVYAARVGGGFPVQVAEQPCALDGDTGCRDPSDASAPEERGPLSATFPSSGNVSEGFTRSCGKAKVRRGNRCVAKRTVARRACAKRKGKAKRRCVRNQVRRLNQAQKRQNRANADRRAAR